MWDNRNQLNETVVLVEENIAIFNKEKNRTLMTQIKLINTDQEIVDLIGIEPTTCSLRTNRSPN